MRKTWTLLSVAVLAGVIALAGCGSEFDHGSVKGRIVSAVDGTPIAGAAVFIGSESDVTDASGLYAIEGINTGRKDMVIRKDGYVLCRPRTSLRALPTPCSARHSSRNSRRPPGVPRTAC
jgi:hypothetical protein